MQKVDVIVIGAGAAGLMCAIEAGKRQRKVLVLDHANKPGKKILMSGGGRCNFTNLNIDPDNYISHNPHFCKSALTCYTQWDFIELVKKHDIPFHEKTLGQLFCDHKAKDILNMLLSECEQAGVKIQLDCHIESILDLENGHFKIKTNLAIFQCESLVIACGGLSIPTMGASPFGYKIAEQFKLKLWPTRAGLVPLTLHTADKERYATLTGISVDSTVRDQDISFRENILFTHRGLSGPAILQISSYWLPGDTVKINLLPEINLYDVLKLMRKAQPQKLLKSPLIDHLPKRMIELFIDNQKLDMPLQAFSDTQLEKLGQQINQWSLKPNGTEGYRTAEVTLGGVDCNALSSKTMQAITIPNLYFIGEVVDVSGRLGGHNFQWAWSSGWAAGQVV